MRSPIIVLAALLAACNQRRVPEPPLLVFAAASLARPLRTLADTFHLRERVRVRAELGGSMDHSRKITDLARVPDVLMLVDDDVIAALQPAHIDWYVRFATNRLVVAYGPRSRHRDSVSTDNWWRIVTKPDVHLGRADPATAPAGKRALEVMRRASGYYHRPPLTDTLFARSPVRYIRPNATELAALLETGEVDYIIEYESVARQYGFSFVALPADLAPAVVYGISVPRAAPNAGAGARFASFVLSPEGMRILREAHVSVLPTPVAIGTGVPPEISALVRTIATAAR